MTATTTITPSVFYFGTPVVLLTTLMPDGRTNITPISSAWALGSTYVLGLGCKSQGSRNLRETGELVINLPDASLADSVERIAATTGAKVVPPAKQDRYRYEPDKWRLGGFTPAPSRLVAPDRIIECPVQLEARVSDAVPFDDDAVAVHVNVLHTHVHEDLVIDGTSYVDLDRWRPLYYTFRHYFAQGERLAVSFKAEQ
jgi:flavin reductase (DIM6/NTAB) family NADH-FMN oxidoreductase RutF